MTIREPKNINPDDLVPMNHFVGKYPIIIDMVYAQADHPDNHFRGLYQPESKLLWAHKLLAPIILLAAVRCEERFGWTLQLNDCLRPVEVQEAMASYGYHKALVSLPGSGAHPRAMAIDIEPLDIDYKKVWMGTPFDSFVEDPTKMANPAARDFVAFDASKADPVAIWQHRADLQFAMCRAASDLGHKFLALPQEWWDFRFPKSVFEKLNPLRESDLHPFQRLTEPAPGAEEILARRYPTAIKASLNEVEAAVLAVIGTKPPLPASRRRRSLAPIN